MVVIRIALLYCFSGNIVSRTVDVTDILGDARMVLDDEDEEGTCTAYTNYKYILVRSHALHGGILSNSSEKGFVLHFALP